MKLEESLKRQKESTMKALQIRMKKGTDYAHPETDCLSNAKVMADIQAALKKHGYEIDTSKPQGVFLWHLLHKVVRILKIWKDEKPPENESLADSHIDLSNYNFLAEHAYIDYMKDKVTQQIIASLLKKGLNMAKKEIEKKKATKNKSKKRPSEVSKKV